MRLGIGATSGMRPKLLRMRLRPVNDFVMDVPRQSNQPQGDPWGHRERPGADRSLLHSVVIVPPNAKSRPARPKGAPRLEQAADRVNGRFAPGPDPATRTQE